MIYNKHFLLLSLFIFFLSMPALAADAPPPWMRQAASITTATYDKDVDGVVLYDEEIVTYGSNGMLTKTENLAIKIINREGRGYARAVADYLVSSGRVREIKAWIIRPDGTWKDYDKKAVIDRIADPDDVYNEGREMIISARDDVDAGFVFGYTITTEERPLLFQDIWQAQSRLPTISSRFVLNLPSGWKATSMTFNHAEIKPQVNGSSYTWQLSDLPFIPIEPMSPTVKNLVPLVAINYQPEDNSQAGARTFSDWVELSRWLTGMYDPQVIINDDIANKAKELTVNAKTELDKIRAIGTYVQNLQYISIDIGVGYGNGLRPRSSDLVFGRGYGDCKDKANLMRAMLKTLNIDAFPVVIFSGDPTFVRREWVTPRQFNHCIVAVKVSNETDAPTVMMHEKLGRLLIFDATDPYTPVGDLPDHEQGSLALIVAGDNGTLSEMPITPAEANTFKRNVAVKLLGDGSIDGVITERSNGQPSTYSRRLFRTLSNADVNRVFEGWLTRGATAARLKKLTPKDNHADASFDLDVEFSAPRYAQLMQGRLLVFKPAIVNRSNSIYLTDKTRTHPVMIDSDSFSESAVFDLPEGFAVDELPDSVNLKTSFGVYQNSYTVKEGKLYYTRSLTTNRTKVPVESYDKIRKFYTDILAAEQSPVVLLKQ